MPINVHLFHDLYRGSTIQFDDKLDCLPFYHNFWSARQKYNKIHAICIHQEMGNENENENKVTKETKNRRKKNRRIKDQSTKEPRKQRIKGPKKHTATTESKNSKQKKKTKTTRR